MASAREVIERRERQEFIAREAKLQRDAENQIEYQKYVQHMESERISPLTFQKWEQFLPEADDPEVRGAFATNLANSAQLLAVTKERVANQSLTDEELAERGFDLRSRVQVPAIELSVNVVRLGFEQFVKRESRFDPKAHIDPVSGFFDRNKLFPSAANFQRVFDLLMSLGIVAPKLERVIESDAAENVNRSGVNLQIDTDPVLEEGKRHEAYATKSVATGPDGTQYTQFELDRLSADEYRRVMRLCGDRQPRFSNVMRPGR
jgi:hypothetical protein